MTQRRGTRALVLIPAIAVLGALAWPVGSAGPGPTPAHAALCDLLHNCKPTPPPPPPSPTPPPTPSPTRPPPPTNPPTFDPGPPINPNPGGPVGPLFGDGSPGGIVGSVPGPAAPPTVDAATIDLLSDPTDPQPGSVATLTVTVSGRNGSDRYGVAAAPVDLVLVTQPGTDAALSATSVTTDASGAATVKLTLSKTRGRHVVDATSGTISAEYVADTLAGAGLASRARHGGTITATPQAPRTNPVPFFAAAAIALVVGFASPYVRRRSLGGWLGPMKPAPARPTPGEPASAIAALRKPASAIAAPAKPASKAGSAKLVARPGTRRAGRLRASSKRTN